jgi:hypothetical protein
LPAIQREKVLGVGVVLTRLFDHFIELRGRIHTRCELAPATSLLYPGMGLLPVGRWGCEKFGPVCYQDYITGSVNPLRDKREEIVPVYCNLLLTSRGKSAFDVSCQITLQFGCIGSVRFLHGICNRMLYK